jgi:hypothetical protein
VSADAKNDQHQTAAEAADRWPVVHEQPLLRAEMRWWRRYRNPDLLPMLQPGCVYVFAGNGRHEVCADAATLRGDEPMLVAASWLSVVCTRFRRLTVLTRVPAAADPLAYFTLSITFRCSVIDPRPVAHAGLTDLHGELESQMRHKPELLAQWHKFPPDAIEQARTEIVGALDDYTRLPPAATGMRITFMGADVSPSRALLRHQTQLRDIRWSHAEEMEQVQRLRDELLSSPEWTEATAVARKERTAEQVATRQFADRDTQTERLIAQVKEWLGSDAAKRAPVDRRRLAEALFARLVDHPNPESQYPTGLVEPPETTNGKPDPDIMAHIAPDDFDQD